MGISDEAPRMSPLADVLSSMQSRLDSLPPSRASLRDFLDTYRRTTLAVRGAIQAGEFEDPGWVERWDVAFAKYYLDALDAELAGSTPVPRPWRLAFAASPSHQPLRRVLLGINAHVNYDLPQALLAVISDEEFADPRTMDRRHRDHAKVDSVLSGRIAAEDAELESASPVSALDRALRPVNRLAARRFLQEARVKVWHNTVELQRARLSGPGAYRTRLAELEVLSAARIADLTAPGQVLLRLAVAGFGITLPPAG
jgi:hypothetical protein